MVAPRVEFDEVEAMLHRVVAPGGRITGLGDFVGREVHIVVRPKKPRKTKEGAARG